jgi:hypothetical protein
LNDAGGINNDESLHLLFSFLCRAEQKPKWKEKREKICKLFSLVRHFFGQNPSLSPSLSLFLLFYYTISDRTVLPHSVLFIVPETQAWKKIFSLVNLFFIRLLTVNGNDNERLTAFIINYIIIIIVITLILFTSSLHWRPQYNENQHNGHARKYFTMRFISF